MVMSQTPRLSEVISAAIEQHQEEVWTAMPGIVVSYDSAKQRANVQPAVDRIFTTEEGELGLEILPVITNVPICFPGAGDYSITFPVKKGDTVLLVFASCSLDRWLSEGGRVKAHDAVRNDLSDAIAVPGLRSFKRSVGSSGISGSAMVVAAPSLKLGSSLASESAIRGDTFWTALDGLLTAINAYATAIQSIADPTSVATAALGTAISAFKALASTYKSTVVKVP